MHIYKYTVLPENNWQKKYEDINFSFHSIDGKYWIENYAYFLSNKAILKINKATREIHDMAISLVEKIIKKNYLPLYNFDEDTNCAIVKSWENNFDYLYGRFDFSVNKESLSIKLLEYNADTPTAILEAGLAQTKWLERYGHNFQQFNLIEKTIQNKLKIIMQKNRTNKIYLGVIKNHKEDLENILYLKDIIEKNKVEVEIIDITELGIDRKDSTNYILDKNDKPIELLFKLYPWEWFLEEEIKNNIINTKTTILEPLWKILLSHKMFLYLMYLEYPDSEYVLKCALNKQDILKLSKNYAIKPFLSREGANVALIENGSIIEVQNGSYGKEGYVYQELCKLPIIDGQAICVGSWIVGDIPCCIGIREDKSLITNNYSYFVPHITL